MPPKHTPTCTYTHPHAHAPQVTTTGRMGCLDRIFDLRHDPTEQVRPRCDCLQSIIHTYIHHT